MSGSRRARRLTAQPLLEALPALLVARLLLLLLIILVLLPLLAGQEPERLDERLVPLAEIIPQSRKQLRLLLHDVAVAIPKGGSHRFPRSARAVALGLRAGHEAVPGVGVLLGLLVGEGEQLAQGGRIRRAVDVLGRGELRRIERRPAHAPTAATVPRAPAGHRPTRRLIAAGILGLDGASREQARGHDQCRTKPHAVAPPHQTASRAPCTARSGSPR